ncbi:MAG: hypothetical protein JWP89_6878 [Schlesneria sp.]|nr:hypothetical protein [Schlesneria sp.]
MRSTFVIMALVVISPLMAGCGPAPQPLWSNDSRHFFFPKSDGSILQFDLEQRATRTFLNPGAQRPCLVALSPREPAICFANAGLGSEGRSAQVGFGMLTDGKIGWSDPTNWGDMNGVRQVAVTSCFWSAAGERILVWSQHKLAVPDLIKSSTPFGSFAVFDVKSKKLTELTTTPPAVILAQAIHVSPLCPSGQGYLGMKLADNGPKFVFVSWDGWEYPLAVSDEAAESLDLRKEMQTGTAFAAILNVKSTEGAVDEKWIRNCFPLPQGVWTDDVLRFTLRTGTIAIDIKKRRIEKEPLTPSQQQEFAAITTADDADSGWRTIQTAAFREGDFALHCRQRADSLQARVDLIDRKLARRRVLLEGTLPANFFVHHLFPAPDGRHILVSLLDATGKQAELHLIQSDGQITEKIEAGASY